MTAKKILEITETISNQFKGPEGHIEDEISVTIFKFSTLIIAALFAGLTLLYLTEGAQLVALSTFIASLLLLGSLWLYNISKQITLASNLFACLLCISTIYRTYSMGGIASPNIHLFSLIPLCMTLVLPAWQSAFWSLIYIGICAFFYFADIAGFRFANALSAESTLRVRVFTTIFVLAITAIIGIYVRTVNRKYRKLINSQKDQKTNLVRVLSHDLTAPISIIDLNLAKEMASSGSSDRLKKIENSLNAIKKMLKHVKDLESLQSGKQTLKLETVNVLLSINEVLEFQEERFKSKHLTLIYSEPKEFQNFEIQADRDSFTYQFLNNLVSNAIKFTPEHGKVGLQVEANDQHVSLTIKDSGIGIPKEILDVIFEPGLQTSRVGTAGEVGTGFGMPIVKTYMDMYNANVKVTSITQEEDSTNCGTTIVLEFPKAQSQISAA